MLTQMLRDSGVPFRQGLRKGNLLLQERRLLESLLPRFPLPIGQRLRNRHVLLWEWLLFCELLYVLDSLQRGHRLWTRYVLLRKWNLRQLMLPGHRTASNRIWAWSKCSIFRIAPGRRCHGNCERQGRAPALLTCASI